MENVLTYILKKNGTIIDHYKVIGPKKQDDDEEFLKDSLYIEKEAVMELLHRNGLMIRYENIDPILEFRIENDDYQIELQTPN